MSHKIILSLHGTSVMPTLQVHIWTRLDIINNGWLKVGRPVFMMFIASFTKIHHWFKSYLWGQRFWYHGPTLPYKLRKICWNTCVKHCHVWHHETNFICRKTLCMRTQLWGLLSSGMWCCRTVVSNILGTWAKSREKSVCMLHYKQYLFFLVYH